MDVIEQGLISADSHVIEPVKVWDGVISPDFWPNGGAMYQDKPGGSDPIARLEEARVDGVIGEVLYPSLGLKVFGIDDRSTQEEACRSYNDWLAEYCSASEALVGVGMVASFDQDAALKEIERSYQLGLKGILLWQTPHPDLPFTSRHYDRIWARAAELKMPVSMHILTGFNYSRELHELGPLQALTEKYRGAVNGKLEMVMAALFDVIISGTFDRIPDARLVLVENELGWLPFALDQWDYYYRRLDARTELGLQKSPSEYFRDNVGVTFFRDPLARILLQEWGTDNCMWSNDYPHPNSPWPESKQYARESIGHLPADQQLKLARGNAQVLYGPFGLDV